MATYFLKVEIEDEFHRGDGTDLPEALEAIAADMTGDPDREDGTIMTEPGQYIGEWRMYRAPNTDLTNDVRTGRVAALMQMAYDLPVDMVEHARAMLTCSMLSPGMTTGDLPKTHSREAILRKARGLIDDMLAGDTTVEER